MKNIINLYKSYVTTIARATRALSLFLAGIKPRPKENSQRVSFPFEEPQDFWKVEDESLGFGECPAGNGKRAVRGKEEWSDEIIVRR